MRPKSTAEAPPLRASNRLVLTPAGERLLRRARQLLAMVDETVRAVRDGVDEAGGEIRVAAPQTLCTRLLAPLMAGHAARMVADGLGVSVLPRIAAEIADLLRDAVLDSFASSSDQPMAAVDVKDAARRIAVAE